MHNARDQLSSDDEVIDDNDNSILMPNSVRKRGINIRDAIGSNMMSLKRIEESLDQAKKEIEAGTANTMMSSEQEKNRRKKTGIKDDGFSSGSEVQDVNEIRIGKTVYNVSLNETAEGKRIETRNKKEEQKNIQKSMKKLKLERQGKPLTLGRARLQEIRAATVKLLIDKHLNQTEDLLKIDKGTIMMVVDIAKRLCWGDQAINKKDCLEFTRNTNETVTNLYLRMGLDENLPKGTQEMIGLAQKMGRLTDIITRNIGNAQANKALYVKLEDMTFVWNIINESFSSLQHSNETKRDILNLRQETRKLEHNVQLGWTAQMVSARQEHMTI
jgi:hypothetical protein